MCVAFQHSSNRNCCYSTARMSSRPSSVASPYLVHQVLKLTALGKNCLPTATGRRPPLVRGTRNVVCLVENLALSLLNALYLVAICARRPHRLGGVGVATRRAPIADYHRRSRMAPVSATGLRTVRSSVTRALTQGHATAQRRRRHATQRRGKRARVANNAPSDRSSAVESF